MPAITCNKKPKGGDHDIDSLMEKRIGVIILMKIVVRMVKT